MKCLREKICRNTIQPVGTKPTHCGLVKSRKHKAMSPWFFCLFLDLMRKKNILLKVSFRKNGWGCDPVWGSFLPVGHFERATRVKFHHWLIPHQGLSMEATETILYACTHAHMHSQPCTNASCRQMLMNVIISDPPLSSLQQHSFRGHRSEKESVPSWLLLIGQTGGPLPGYQLTLRT